MYVVAIGALMGIFTGVLVGCMVRLFFVVVWCVMSV